MKRIKEDNTVEIKEEVRIPGTDIILEAGDKIEILKEQSIFASEAYSEIIDFSVRSDIGEILSLFIGTFGKILEDKGKDQADSAEDARRILIQYLTRFSAVDAYIGDYF